jgi:hypothetical protein
VTGKVDECKVLGQVEGAQGVLTQPKMSQGLQAYLVLPLGYDGDQKLT